jgi:oligopeptide/dipeptide ABC transporter ATP-binding protein
VGEAGGGKTTRGRRAIRRRAPDKGAIRVEGTDISNLAGEELRTTRRRMQIIFQDPYSSLNPRMKVRDIVGEGWLVHGLAKGLELREKASRLLERVGLSAEAGEKYPHEFSGGQRQRIGIARAIALSPGLVVADEPVSALDVSVQAQILNLLKDLQEEYRMAYLFVSHDLRAIRHVSDHVAVMYLGKILETGRTAELFREPIHPYTRSLPLRRPMLGDAPPERIVLAGDIPSPIAPPPGAGSTRAASWRRRNARRSARCCARSPRAASPHPLRLKQAAPPNPAQRNRSAPAASNVKIFQIFPPTKEPAWKRTHSPAPPCACRFPFCCSRRPFRPRSPAPEPSTSEGRPDRHQGAPWTWREDMRSNNYVFPRGMARDGGLGEKSLQWTSRYGSV